MPDTPKELFKGLFRVADAKLDRPLKKRSKNQGVQGGNPQ